MEKPLWMWAGFIALVLILLVVDLGLFHRRQREISIKESLWMSVFYIVVACLFGGAVWQELGPQSGKEYFTGFLVEKSLSMDNVFVISLIFTYLQIPRIYQHRVLFWGILGVIVLRGIMIGVGAALVEEFHWILYLFAAFLMVTGVKMLFAGDEEPDIEQNPILKFLRKYLPITQELHGNRFMIRAPHPEAPRRKITMYTPLFVALVFIELIDLVFAVDSVPAIFAITTDPYVIYTSNIFAILGLRALYFALAVIIHRFSYLKYALALVLVFIGSKVFVTDFLLDGEKFPASVSLAVTFGLLAGGVAVSLLKTGKMAKPHDNSTPAS